MLVMSTLHPLSSASCKLSTRQMADMPGVATQENCQSHASAESMLKLTKRPAVLSWSNAVHHQQEGWDEPARIVHPIRVTAIQQGPPGHRFPS